jgi:hypothetical protein
VHSLCWKVSAFHYVAAALNTVQALSSSSGRRSVLQLQLQGHSGLQEPWKEGGEGQQAHTELMPMVDWHWQQQ